MLFCIVKLPRILALVKTDAFSIAQDCQVHLERHKTVDSLLSSIQDSEVAHCKTFLKEKLRRQEAQPLLTPQDRREHGDENSSQQASTQLNELESRENAEMAAKRVVKWTVWFLMALILIGTVLGTFLVSMPLQKSVHAPGIPLRLYRWLCVIEQLSAHTAIIGQFGAWGVDNLAAAIIVTRCS